MDLNKVTLLTEAEQKVVEDLAKAWNAFLKLEPVHNDEQAEFRTAIHSAQSMIFARPVSKELAWLPVLIEDDDGQRLVVNLDDLWGGSGYFYTKFDVGNQAHDVVIRQVDREKFLDAMAVEFRNRVESSLEPYNENED